MEKLNFNYCKKPHASELLSQILSSLIYLFKTCYTYLSLSHLRIGFHDMNWEKVSYTQSYVVNTILNTPLFWNVLLGFLNFFFFLIGQKMRVNYCFICLTHFFWYYQTLKNMKNYFYIRFSIKTNKTYVCWDNLHFLLFYGSFWWGQWGN